MVLVVIIGYLVGSSHVPDQPLREKFLRTIKAGDYDGVAKLLARNSRLVSIRDQDQRTPLHLAVMEGQVRTVELLLAKGASVRTGEEAGYTPLHYAAQYGRPEIAALLLDRGARLNVKSDLGATPLLDAVTWGNRDVVDLLLSKGARIDCRTGGGSTPLDIATAAGREHIVRALLAHGAHAEARDGSASALLFLAARRRGTCAVAKLFIERGADVNRSTEEMNPLYWAVLRGKTNLVQLLLSEGAKADVFVASILGDTNRVAELLAWDSRLANARDLATWTPLHWAAYVNQPEVAQMLVRKGAGVDARTEYAINWQGRRQDRGDTPLHFAAMEGHRSLAQLLLEKGADVNAKGERDETPLYVAAARNRTELVELLLGRKASVNTTNLWGETPLCNASRLGNERMVEHLIANGADVNLGQPLFGALWNENPRVAELLLASAADICATRYGDTALRTALRAGHKHLAERFLRQGASQDFFSVCALGNTDEVLAFLSRDPALLHQSDTNRWTGLHYAANAGNKPVVALLLAKGADVNAGRGTEKDWYRRETALHLAAGNGLEDVVELLLAAGADIEARGAPFGGHWSKGPWALSTGLTPLHFALGRGQRRTVMVLLSHKADPNATVWYPPPGVSADNSKRRNRAIGQARNSALHPLTALDHATIAGDKEMVDLLFAHGADLNRQDREALRSPVSMANTEMIGFLIAKGANVKAKDSYRRTYLHQAALEGRTAAIEILLKHGVEIDAKDRFGETALDAALRTEHEEIAALLRQHEARTSPQ